VFEKWRLYSISEGEAYSLKVSAWVSLHNNGAELKGRARPLENALLSACIWPVEVNSAFQHLLTRAKHSSDAKGTLSILARCDGALSFLPKGHRHACIG